MPKNKRDGPATFQLSAFSKSLFLKIMAMIYLFAMFEMPMFKE